MREAGALPARRGRRPPVTLYNYMHNDERHLYETLDEGVRNELERRALLDILLEPKYERAFLQRYFPHRLSADLAPFHMRLVGTALYEPRGLVLYPQGHGKSTLITQLLPILEIIRNPDIRIVGILKNDDEAGGAIASVRAEFEANELLIEDYGPFKPMDGDPAHPWKADWISTIQRKRVGKEPAYAVFGSGAKNVLGHRSDWVICDDVVTEKNSATPEQREKMLVWFKEAVSTSPEKVRAGEIAGRITVVGTKFHPKDLYSTIEKMTDRNGNARYKVQLEDAIADEAEQRTLWPERWSWDDLMDEKQTLGTLSFNKRYRNRPVDESMQPFREAYIFGEGDHTGCLDHHRSIGDFEPDWRIFQALDPAVGSTKNAKFVGHVVFGIPQEEPSLRYLIEINREQLTLPQQVDLLISTHMKYTNMVLTVIETNSYQKGLEQAVQDAMERMGITLRVEGHTTGINKLDPEIGLHSLSPLLENGKLRFPWRDPESRRKSGLLIQEFVEYPFFAYTDLMMATWFGNLKASTTMPNFKSFNRLNPASMYRRRNKRRTVRNPVFYNQSNRIPGGA